MSVVTYIIINSIRYKISQEKRHDCRHKAQITKKDKHPDYERYDRSFNYGKEK
ncbi:MAG: hypothetical protein JWN50_483 [Parcubacteria group bacterium]|nr:hypothetical protein [Parcubacteria group bacterium]